MSGTNLDMFLKSRKKVHQQVLLNGIVAIVILLIATFLLSLVLPTSSMELWFTALAIVVIAGWLGVNHYANKLIEAEKIIFKLNKEFQLSNKVKGSNEFTSSDKLLITSLSK